MSKSSQDLQSTDPCPIAPVVGLIFGRWTSHVLWALTQSGRLRFTELSAQLPAITPKILTERLRQLERNGLVKRTYHAEVPPRVEYEATELAHTLSPIFTALTDWSEAHLPEVVQSQCVFDAEAVSRR